MNYYYGRKMYRNLDLKEQEGGEVNPIPGEALDKIHCRDARNLGFLPDCCVDLALTSPPYNVGKAYDQDLDLTEYVELLRSVFAETYRVLVPGGRACINVGNVGRKPYVPLTHRVADIMNSLGFLNRGEIVWDKGASAGSQTAWGSWRSPSNPVLRDRHEYILIFSKMRFKRDNSYNRESTISRDEFLQFTKSIWSFRTESAKKIGHPAPFPVELPYRCIQLYSFKNDVVLDPFCGSGSTCIAAKRTGRHFVGVELNPNYVKLAEQRIAAERRSQLYVAGTGYTQRPNPQTVITVAILTALMQTRLNRKLTRPMGAS
jgi:site-specific DNA-methyltransferase (adenine-specific)